MKRYHPQAISSTLYILCIVSNYKTSHSFHVFKSTARYVTPRMQISASRSYTNVDPRKHTMRKSPVLEGIDELLLETTLDASCILNDIDQAHETDLLLAKSACLPFEKATNDSNNWIRNSIQYESIRVKVADERLSPSAQSLQERLIAIRTKESTPILNPEEIQLLKLATESYWSNQSVNSSSSRFTYQRRGNSEAHLSDVVTFSREMNNDITTVVDELLLRRVYPWIREAFLSSEKDVDPENLGMYVYDSLFIRYNATEANSRISENASQTKNISRRTGAGQPLHRDLGYVSVNIMLNDPDEFEGGGTFFEQQLLSTSSWDGVRFKTKSTSDLLPLKPISAGHALAHYSSDRHAGAATTAGIRDILVIFVAVADGSHEGLDNSSQVKRPKLRAPIWERVARLKSTARSYCQRCFVSDASIHNIHDEFLCRILHLRLAIDSVPFDGETWHYLGMTLSEYEDTVNTDERRQSFDKSVLDLAIACLKEGAKYTPCDARLYNNIGLAWERKLAQFTSSTDAKENDYKHIHTKIKSAYQNAVTINSCCSVIGCDVVADYERTCLNFGLYLSYQNDFKGAIDVLETIELTTVKLRDLDMMSPARQRVIEDAHCLLLFCKKQYDMCSIAAMGKR